MKQLFRVFGLRGLILWYKLKIRKSPAVRLPLYGRIDIRPNTADYHVFRQVFVEKQYQFPYRMYFKGTPDIYDLGAHIGMFSLFIRMVFINSKIVAVEPDPGNVHFLRMNTREHKNISVWEGAVISDKVRNPKVYYFQGKDNWDGQVVADYSFGGKEVRGYKMKDLLTGSTDAIVKMDVEGMEREIFQGDTSWLQHVALLIIELHDRIVPGCGNAVAEAVVKEWGGGDQGGYEMIENGENLFIIRTNTTK